MYIKLNKVCSECGSDDYENFSNKKKHGTRCLECGHENVTSDVNDSSSETIYKLDETKSTF